MKVRKKGIDHLRSKYRDALFAVFLLYDKEELNGNEEYVKRYRSMVSKCQKNPMKFTEEEFQLLIILIDRFLRDAEKGIKECRESEDWELLEEWEIDKEEVSAARDKLIRLKRGH